MPVVDFVKQCSLGKTQIGVEAQSVFSSKPPVEVAQTITALWRRLRFQFDKLKQKMLRLMHTNSKLPFTKSFVLAQE